MSFPNTRLSVVARTRSADEETRRVAWATIIDAYWKPVYKYLRLKWSLDPDDAADLTQAFFTTTLEKDIVERYDPSRARFRIYLRLCLDGFASNARKAEGRLKRGGAVTMVPLDFETAEGEIDVADRQGSRAARLTREAHILARLDHPGIVPVHDAGLLPDGRAFYVMKLVRGCSLEQVLAQNTALTHRLSLFARVLDAVAFAHAHGVVHRDLKPENIMVGSFGEVFVMDWGVAQDGAADAEAAVVGTPGFMPPEQERARDGVDGRADVFALAAVLRQLMGASPARALKAIAEKAQHRSPDERYQTVAALASDLARLRDHQPVAAYRESLAERLLRVYRRYELPILLLLAYVMMRFALLIWGGV